MMNKTDIVKIDISKDPIVRNFVPRIIGEADGKADRFGVEIWDGNVPASLAGSACVGYFIRADGITLILQGVCTGGQAYVDLPAAAYAVEGRFKLTIKTTGTWGSDTLRIIDGTVENVTTDTLADPASVIPSLASLTEAAEAAEDAADDINALSITATQISGTRYKIAVSIST